MSRVLISGGSGLIGQHLCKKLMERNYDVAILSRNPYSSAQVPSYYWNLARNEIDREAINSFDYIIHLAGVNIGARRWTHKRKLEITNSRIKSTHLIYNSIEKENSRLKAFISASAIGYYGAKTSDKIFKETDPAAGDFLGQVCEKWELAADSFSNMGVRTVKIRTGIVLSELGGALNKLTLPARLGIASAIGTGKQFMPWIHMEDLCDIYIKALEDETMAGPYNAVAPEHITNKEFIRKIAQTLHKPFWFPDIPSFIMKILFGEMSAMLLKGSRVSCDKIQDAGLQFRFPDLDSALNNLYSE